MEQKLEEMIMQYRLDGYEIYEFLDYKKATRSKEITWFEASMFLPDTFEKNIKKRVSFVDTLQETMAACL